jgi:Mg2+-importing ATPase
LLVTTSLGALAAGVVLALGPWAQVFGFTALPMPLLAMITVITAVYLAAAEAAKRAAMSRWGAPARMRPPIAL